MNTQEIIAQVVATELANHTEVYLNTNLLGVLVKDVIIDCQNAAEDDFSERGIAYDHDAEVKAEAERQLNEKHVVILEKSGTRKAIGWFLDYKKAERFMDIVQDYNQTCRYYIHS